MNRNHLSNTFLLSFVIFLILLLSSCYASPIIPTETTTSELPKEVYSPPSLQGLGLDNYKIAPTLSQTEITFKVLAPPETPDDQAVYLNILDEVTGLAMNSEKYPMQRSDNENINGSYYSLTLSFSIGTLVTYRYERQTATAPVSEYTANGTPVRYRLYHVEGPGNVEDIVSRWTDTASNWPSGRIKGKVIDNSTGELIPNLLITAGGNQVITAYDGSFLFEGLPPGIHNLVVTAMDGSYNTFQQGAEVAINSTTPAEISLNKANLINVVFVTLLPKDTPPIVPIRIAGSLYQFGNTFATLDGGMSSMVSNMPIMTALSDGRYILRASLPAGAFLQYKYTLGDGFWNAEHTPDSDFRLRQLIVPEEDTVIQDVVESWLSGPQKQITFDIVAPENTPSTDSVAIQFNPLYGWTIPLPMWSLGNNRWAYILYSPLNIPGEISYRFCRNGQCNLADDERTVGDKAIGFKITPSNQPQVIKDIIPAWSMWPAIPPQTSFDHETTIPLTNPIMNGVEFVPYYHPSWKALFPNALGLLLNNNNNSIITTPTWSWISQNPPVLQQKIGQDANYFDLLEILNQSSNQGLQNFIFPMNQFASSSDNWWAGTIHDYSWWLVWFDQYQTFLNHHADLAERTDSLGLVIGGDWILPALPDGIMPDGQSSGVPTDAEDRWRSIIADLRSKFSGKIYWALSPETITNAPKFLDAIDGIYLIWSTPLSNSPDSGIEEMKANTSKLIEDQIQPFIERIQKPLILAIGIPSANGGTTDCIPTITSDCINPQELTINNPGIFDVSLDLQEQLDGYVTLIDIFIAKSWVEGIISRGYYPPVQLLDTSLSTNGKPVLEFTKTVFANTP
jgi:hypothetical protein